MVRSAALAVLILLAVAAPAGARPFETGYFDVRISERGPQRDRLLNDARASGAQWTRVLVYWAGIAPDRPADATNPRDPAYDWGSLGADVRAAHRRGQKVLVSIGGGGAPAWAEGRGRPSSALQGTWRPDPRAYGRFAQAVARHLRPLGVEAYGIWNEPNLAEYLTPQWVRRGGRFVLASPGHYRAMLNAAYPRIKAVSPRVPVVTAGTSPFGNPANVLPARVRPLLFWRDLVSRPVSFDAASHHPYPGPFQGPLYRPFSRDDAVVAQVGQVGRIVREGVRRGRVLPRRAKRLWVTEWAWESSPPNAFGPSLRRHARWLEYALYLFWRQGVDTALWYQVRDSQSRSLEAFQTGTFFSDGTRKPAFTAFRFPFVTAPDGRGRVRVWGRAPVAGRLVVERRAGRSWRAVRALRAGRRAVFQIRRLRLAAGTVLRARVGREVSLDWNVGREKLR